MMFGEIDPELTYRNGDPIYLLSNNQHQTEQQRLDPDRNFQPADRVMAFGMALMHKKKKNS
jgi:hypothetical protein